MHPLPLLITELQMAKMKLLQSFELPDDHRHSIERNEHMKLANSSYLQSVAAYFHSRHTGGLPGRTGEAFHGAERKEWHCLFIGKMCRKV